MDIPVSRAVTWSIDKKMQLLSDREPYLVPAESRYKEHLARLQNTILTSGILKLRKHFQIWRVTVDLALDRLPVRAERVGVETVQVTAEEPHLLPAQHHSGQADPAGTDPQSSQTSVS